MICKSMDRFVYNRNLRHEIGKTIPSSLAVREISPFEFLKLSFIHMQKSGPSQASKIKIFCENSKQLLINVANYFY